MPPGPISTSLSTRCGVSSASRSAAATAVGVADQVRGVDAEFVEQPADHVGEVAERIGWSTPLAERP